MDIEDRETESVIIDPLPDILSQNTFSHPSRPKIKCLERDSHQAFASLSGEEEKSIFLNILLTPFHFKTTCEAWVEKDAKQRSHQGDYQDHVKKMYPCPSLLKSSLLTLNSHYL